MNRLLIIPILLFGSVVELFGAAGEEKPKRISFTLEGFISGENVERQKPVIRGGIDFERIETVSGKPFGELFDTAFKRGVPMLIVAVLTASSRGFIIDYLDGFGIFKDAASLSSDERKLPFGQLVSNYIVRHYRSSSTGLLLSGNKIIHFYPNGVMTLDFSAVINEEKIRAAEAVIKLFFDQDRDKREKLTKYALWRFEEEPSIASAKVAKFWVDQGSAAEDLHNAKVLNEYLAAHEDTSTPGEYVYRELG